MALELGDPALLASFALTNALSAAGNITDGTGDFIQFMAGTGANVFNNGNFWDGSVNFQREVAPSASSSPANFGRSARLTGKPSAWKGVVIAALQIELGTTGGIGSLTECVLVQASTFRYIAQASDVTFDE